MARQTRLDGFPLFGSLLFVAVGCVEPAADRALEVVVFVSATKLEVQLHHPGSCRVRTAFPATASCEVVGWAVPPFATSIRTPICYPEPTCVTEIRLERAGEVVAIEPGQTMDIQADTAGLGGRLVLSGCGDPITVELPPPLGDDVEFDIAAEGGTIQVGASGLAVSGVLGRTAALPSLYTGFASACVSDGAPVELPLADDYDLYFVSSFALGEPNVSADGAVRAFPASYHEEVVSTLVDLGPLWAASVALAQQSPLYPTCEAYCVGVDEACGPIGDIEQCAVPCVAAGSSKPSCGDEWEALLQCRHDSVSCDTGPATGNSESEPTTCSDQQLASDTCLGVGTEGTPTE